VVVSVSDASSVSNRSAAHMTTLLGAQKRALEMMLQSAPLPDVLAHLARVVEELAEGRAVASILLLDEDGLLRNGASPSLPDDYLREIDRLKPDAQELSLCFDPETDLIGPFDDGIPLFDDGKPSEQLNSVLKFCEEFEVSAQRTSAFVKELETAELLIEGEVSIQPDGSDKPFLYRGFRMVDENKLRDMNGDQLRKINQNGILPLIMAHLFSLSLVRDIFARQKELGKVPPQDMTAPATA
jgi:hypothetical protein